MNGTEMIVYTCSKCGFCFSKKENADNCCICSMCGKESPRTHTCAGCQKIKDDNYEKSKFEKAIKITFEDYKGDMIWYDDVFASDFDELMDSHEQVIEYGWATKTTYPKIYPEYILTNLAESLELSNDYNPLDFINNADELVNFITEWNKKQTKKIFYPDYSIAVLAPEDSIKRWRDQDEV